MRKFIYTSQHITGDVLAGFDEKSGLLLLIDLSKSEMSYDQHYNFMLKFPRTLKEFLELEKEKPNERKITEVFDTITFDDFWNRYDHKALSSKKKAKAIWDKMPSVEQQRAYNHIAKYSKLVAQQGIQKKHAETYLNSYLWDN
jgi:hypothetical protein